MDDFVAPKGTQIRRGLQSTPRPTPGRPAKTWKLERIEVAQRSGPSLEGPGIGGRVKHLGSQVRDKRQKLDVGHVRILPRHIKLQVRTTQAQCFLAFEPGEISV